MTTEVVVSCACTDESCYLALRVTTKGDTKRVFIVGNELNHKEPVVILDTKGIELLRTALQGTSP